MKQISSNSGTGRKLSQPKLALEKSPSVKKEGVLIILFCAHEAWLCIGMHLKSHLPTNAFIELPSAFYISDFRLPRVEAAETFRMMNALITVAS